MTTLAYHSFIGVEPDESSSSDECQHPNKMYTGAPYDGPGGCKSWLYYTCPDCKERWREEEVRPEQKRTTCACGPAGACDVCDPEPESGLQAAEQAHRQLLAEVEDWHASKEMPAEPPMTPEEEEQAPEDGEGVCFYPNCTCAPKALCPGATPPQPERRPPYAVAYSVQGHLYEVALPGDATVRAVDGALVITHRLGPVAGIVQAAPIGEEGA